MRTFAQILKRALADRGLSQSAFARLVGAHPSSVNKALRGRSAPRIDRGPKWAATLQLTAAERREFLAALDLANSPASVQRLVRQLSRSK